MELQAAAVAACSSSSVMCWVIVDGVAGVRVPNDGAALQRRQQQQQCKRALKCTEETMCTLLMQACVLL
jgi:hypothetical protein